MEFVNSIAQIVHQEVGGAGRAGVCERGAQDGGHESSLGQQGAAYARRLGVTPPLPPAPPHHPQVALHGGAANKNIGDAFLLVWKLGATGRRPAASSSSRRTSTLTDLTARASATAALARTRSAGDSTHSGRSSRNSMGAASSARPTSGARWPAAGAAG